MFPFKTALNTSCLFPFRLDVKEQVSIAAEAGFEGIELWIRDIETYQAKGGKLKDLKMHIADAGIAFVNTIAFFPWADANETVREQALLQAKREMEMLVQLGCVAIATPPFGQMEGVTLDALADRFSRLTDLAKTIGIEPYLEFWGRSKILSDLNEALFVAMNSNMSNVKILIDPFHMYIGGSDVTDLDRLRSTHIGIVHVNDYPAVPSRDQIEDRDRVFPGDGIAPSSEIAKLLYRAGYRGYLSLELFIENYGNSTALDVAKLGLKKIKTAYRMAPDSGDSVVS